MLMETELEQYLTGVISKLIEEKKKQNISPASAMTVDIQNQLIADMKATLNAMCRKGVLRYNKSLNDIMFEFIENGDKTI